MVLLHINFSLLVSICHALKQTLHPYQTANGAYTIITTITIMTRTSNVAMATVIVVMITSVRLHVLHYHDFCGVFCLPFPASS